MSVDEANSYLFSKKLITRFKNNLDILLAYGIVGYCEIETIKYPEILEEIKEIVKWYLTLDSDKNKEDIVNWMFFFNEISTIKDCNKFIEAMSIYNMNMYWKDKFIKE